MMMKKIMQSVMAVALALGIAVSSYQPAEAGRGGRFAAGVAAGVIGLTILGAAAHADRGYHRSECYRGEERCAWSGRRCWENRWGETVCRRGVYKCWRPTYCD